MSKFSRSIKREVARMGLPHDERVRGYEMDSHLLGRLIVAAFRRTSAILSGWSVVERPDETDGVYVKFNGTLYRAPVDAERLDNVVNGIAYRCEDR